VAVRTTKSTILLTMFLKRFIQKNFSQSQHYSFFRAIYRALFKPLVYLAASVFKFIFNSFNISFVIERYAVLDESKFSRHLLLRGFNGVTYIGKRYYFSKKVRRRNFRNNQKVIRDLSNIKNYAGEPEIPVSILESALLNYGTYEKSKSKVKLSNLATHLLRPIKGNVSEKIFMPEEESFFHFYIQTIPFILRHQSENLIYMNLNPRSFQLEVLETLGLNPNPIMKKHKSERVSIPSQVGHYPSRIEVLFLRNYLEKLGYKRTPTQNLYISRRGNKNGRHVLNEDDLMKILGDYDFLCVDPSELSFKNQLELFSKANIVIGPHGAALSHVVNFPNESQVLELNGSRDIRWHIRNMCFDLNIKHTILLGESIDNGNFKINLDLVRDFLKKT
jgi:hypothetical protein